MFAEEKERPTQLLGTDGQDLFLHTDDEDDVAPADAIPLQPIRKKPSDVILRDGKKSQRRRATRTGIHLVYNGIFVVLMNLIWLNIAAVVKWLIPFGSILFEFVNLIASVINLINKEKPWYLIGAVILGALASMVIMGLIDAFRFGSTSAFVAGAFAAGPAVFTAVLGLFALLNFVKLGFTIKDCIKNPASRTPLKALSIVSQSVKVAGLIALAGLMIPFFAAIGAVMAGANPYSLIVLAVGVSTAIVVLTTVKLVKTLVENIVWKKTIAELKKKNLDPYELLGITNAKLLTLEEKITSEASKSNTLGEKIKEAFKNFAQHAKNIWNDSPLADLFARTAKQKQTLLDARTQAAAIKSNSSSAYIRKDYEIAFKAAEYDPDRQSLIKRAYDLVCNARGRLKYEESLEEEAKPEEVRGRSALPVRDVERVPRGNPYAPVIQPAASNGYVRLNDQQQQDGVGRTSPVLTGRVIEV